MSFIKQNHRMVVKYLWPYPLPGKVKLLRWHRHQQGVFTLSYSTHVRALEIRGACHEQEEWKPSPVPYVPCLCLLSHFTPVVPRAVVTRQLQTHSRALQPRGLGPAPCGPGQARDTRLVAPVVCHRLVAGAGVRAPSPAPQSQRLMNPLHGDAFSTSC